MAEIRLGKLVSGDFVIGVNDEEKKGIKNIGSLQFVPAENGGMSVALIPFGFPFENEFTGFISNDKIIYEIEKVPEDLQNKYTEATSNIKLISGSKSTRPKTLRSLRPSLRSVTTVRTLHKRLIPPLWQPARCVLRRSNSAKSMNSRLCCMI